MKVKQLKIVNIGMIESETIELNKPLIIFYGEIRAGKSTLLNAVRWVCGGSFPADIIRHGQTEAEIELTLENGSLRREFYRSSDGSTRARALVFIRDGVLESNPAA